MVNVVLKKLQVNHLALGHGRFQSRKYGPVVFDTQQCGFGIPLAPSRALAELQVENHCPLKEL